MKKSIVILFASLILASYVSAKGKVSFESEEGSLLISNNTSQDVVVFAGQVQRKIVLGGIRSGEERSFNLSKVPKISSGSALLVRIVPFATYNKKKIITESDVVYTRLVIYDPRSGESDTFLNIPREIDMKQENCIYITNTSDFVLELRDGDPIRGDVVATLLPGAYNSRVFLLPKDSGAVYSLFPNFVYVNPNTSEITTITASRVDMKRIYPGLTAGDAQILFFSAPKDDRLSYNVAFVKIENNTNLDCEFINGEVTLKSQRGFSFIRSGEVAVYELPIDIKEGELYNRLLFEFDDFRQIFLNPYNFKAGYEYKITVTRINDKLEYDIREIGRKNILENAGIELFMEGF